MLNLIKNQNSEIEVLLKRAILFAEDGEFSKADECCEKVLNIDPENAIVYCVKLMIELKVQSIDDISKHNKPLDDNSNFKKIIRFGSQGIVEKMNEINSNIKQSLYGQGKQLVPTKPKKALKIFETLSDYADAENYISRCKENIAVNKKKNFKKIIKISIVFAVIILLVISTLKFVIPGINYNKAVELMNNGKYQEAITKFTELGDYKDSSEMYKEATYRYAIDLCEKDEMLLSLSEFMKVYSYKDSMDYINKYNDTSHKVPLYHLTKDGKIDVDYYLYDNYEYCNFIGDTNIENWRDVTAISKSAYHVVGLKEDGTVIVKGRDDFRLTIPNKYRGTYYSDIITTCNYGQCNVDNWIDIINIQTNKKHTIGLRKDGTVVAAGDNSYAQCNVENWTNIIDIYALYEHTIGLKKDGTVVATGNNKYGQCNLESWNNIVCISAVDTHTIGISKDGTVVATGNNKYGQCNVKNWSDIVAVSTSYICTIGLKSDGTVVGAGYYNKEIENWKDIVSIDSSDFQIIGLKKDGTVVTAGNNGGEKHNTYGANDVVAVATSDNISYIQQKDGTIIETGFYDYYNVRYNNKLPTMK